eukprot:9478059-Pyramimonas_sp.AAC.1
MAARAVWRQDARLARRLHGPSALARRNLAFADSGVVYIADGGGLQEPCDGLQPGPLRRDRTAPSSRWTPSPTAAAR